MRKAIYIVVSFFLLSLLLLFPEISFERVKFGLVFCGNTVIPSLFPITCISIFLTKLILEYNQNKKIPMTALLFIFSCLGGYAVGAKLIETAYTEGNISKKSAQTMQYFCINGGAGFIIVAVGFAIYNQKEIGYILYFSHIMYSLLIFLFLRKKISIKTNANKEKSNLCDTFCLSVSEAANTLIKVCSFVIVFSIINGYLERIKLLRFFTYFTELTMALNKTRNIYFSAFLIGVGGLSVLFQVMSISKNVGINIKFFITSLIFHGVFSAIITFVLVNLLGITPPVFSSNGKIVLNALQSNISVSVSMIIMVILLILSIERKNNGGNLKEDLLQ